MANAQTTMTADALRLQEWKECRSTIGRLDTILADLRKFGFSIITGLLTAAAFLGVSATQNVPALSTDAGAAVFIVVMVLVAALFSVDTYYQVLLSGAVERALDMEAEALSINLTKKISINATRCGSSFMTMSLYIILLAAAGGMGLFAAKGMNKMAVSSPGTWALVVANVVLVNAAYLVVVVSLALIVLWLFYRRHFWVTLIIGIILPLLTVFGLEWFLSKSHVNDPLSMYLWIVTVGMLLALYIEYYWLYIAWQSNLYRQKRR